MQDYQNLVRQMSDKIMLNFRCPTEVLEAIDSLGKERKVTPQFACDRRVLFRVAIAVPALLAAIY
jgi:hypothetical protein